MVLLKILLFLIAGYYLFSLLSRWLFPKLLNHVAEKAKQRMDDQFQAFFEGQVKEEQTPDGIRFTRGKKGPKRNTEDLGEYVDFEEIP